MRRLLGGFVLALVAVALVPGSALATHSNGTGPDKDFLTGSYKGFCPTPLGTFACHVHNNGSSESASGPGIPATGHFYIDFSSTPVGPVHLSGDIICLTAIGNSAWVRSVITQSNTPIAPPGFGIFGRNVDNGEGQKDPPDEATGFLTGPPPLTCPTLPLTTIPNVSGNQVVHDGV